MNPLPIVGLKPACHPEEIAPGIGCHRHVLEEIRCHTACFCRSVTVDPVTGAAQVRAEC